MQEMGMNVRRRHPESVLTRNAHKLRGVWRLFLADGASMCDEIIKSRSVSLRIYTQRKNRGTHSG